MFILFAQLIQFGGGSIHQVNYMEIMCSVFLYTHFSTITSLLYVSSIYRGKLVCLFAWRGGGGRVELPPPPHMH